MFIIINQISNTFFFGAFPELLYYLFGYLESSTHIKDAKCVFFYLFSKYHNISNIWHIPPALKTINNDQPLWSSSQHLVNKNMVNVCPWRREVYSTYMSFMNTEHWSRYVGQMAFLCKGWWRCNVINNTSIRTTPVMLMILFLTFESRLIWHVVNYCSNRSYMLRIAIYNMSYLLRKMDGV